VPFLSLVTVVVEDYDPAIAFFVEVLGFELVEDSPSTTRKGAAKRWVVVRPPGAETGIVLARADGAAEAGAVGSQTGGRVAFFLRVEDFIATYDRIVDSGATVEGSPRDEPYGRVVVFEDVAGNRWDLIGPA
jgi:predicted enzyme related to lactoylglutathione lyase